MRVFFFFQAEDGIRDVAVTGVQTCALPICCVLRHGQDHSLFERELCAGGHGVENLLNFRWTGFHRRQTASAYRGGRHFMSILPEEAARGATSRRSTISLAALLQNARYSQASSLSRTRLGCQNKKIDVFSAFPAPRQLSVSGDSRAAPSSSAPNDSPLAAPTLIH